MGFGSNLGYALFGLLVILGYGAMVFQGIEPFSARTVRPAAGAPRASARTAGPRRVPSFIWIGGFGGK